MRIECQELVERFFKGDELKFDQLGACGQELVLRHLQMRSDARIGVVA